MTIGVVFDQKERGKDNFAVFTIPVYREVLEMSRVARNFSDDVKCEDLKWF